MMAPNLVPSEVPGWADTFGSLYTAFDALGKKLLRAIALDLALPPDTFDRAVAEVQSCVVLRRVSSVLASRSVAAP